MIAVFIVIFALIAYAAFSSQFKHTRWLRLRKPDEHNRLVCHASQIVRAACANGQKLALKTSNHAFGLRRQAQATKLDMSAFDHVLGFCGPNNSHVEFEASCTIEQILVFLEKHGRTLPTIPDMKHLKMGGIVAGIGGGSGAYMSGLFHEALVECDVLLGDGSLVRRCSPQNHAQLFHALPGTLGTLGYMTRMVMRTVPAHRYVQTINIRCDSINAFLRLVNGVDARDPAPDFVDGTAFSKHHIVCVLGFKRHNIAPNERVDNFVNHRVYWESLRDTESISRHTMLFMEYVYRFQTDLYYTSANPNVPSFLRQPWLRRCLLPFKSMVPLAHAVLEKIMPVNIDLMCSDTVIPMRNAAAFWNQFCDTASLFPVYLCPSRPRKDTTKSGHALFWTHEPCLDFGIAYGVMPATKDQTLALHAMLESIMLEQKGYKLPYTLTKLTEEQFWASRGGPKKKQLYDGIRARYRAVGAFLDVYTKLK